MHTVTSAEIDPIMLNIMICDALHLLTLSPPSLFRSYTHTHTPVLVNVLKRLGVVDGKDTEETLPCPHILVPHGAVLLLTCSVQDVQQTGLSINHHLFSVRVL